MEHIKKIDEFRLPFIPERTIDLHDIFIEFTKSKRKHLEEVRKIRRKLDNENGRYAQRYKEELDSYISYLSNIPANLMKGDNGKYIGNITQD